MIQEGTYIPSIPRPNLDEYKQELTVVEESIKQKEADEKVDVLIDDKFKERSYEEYRDMIFKYQWIIKTWMRYTLSPEDYKDKGVFVSGDLKQDLEMMDSETTTTRSIAQLAEMFNDGYEFIIERLEDMEKIFNIIQEYTAYVGKKLSTSLHFQYGDELPDNIKELLKDIVKLQNLGNKIFPAMININREYVQYTSGLLGFLQYEKHLDGSQLMFDPALKYGISLKDYKLSENRDEFTGEYNAIDLQKHFDPSYFKHFKGLL